MMEEKLNCLMEETTLNLSTMMRRPRDDIEDWNVHMVQNELITKSMM